MAHDLRTFQPSKAGAYDAGIVTIFFDARKTGPPLSLYRTSVFQSLWLEAMYVLGWPSLHRKDLEPGNLRLVWYTHAGNKGSRDFPLWKAYAVREMFEALSDGGFGPMVFGWSAENPFPEIGGCEPPPQPKMEQPKKATTWSGAVSGHSDKNGSTPHDRVMAIIETYEQQEAEKRKEEVERASRAKIGVSAGDAFV